MCKGGKHITPNPNFHYLIGKDGNPPASHQPNWYTCCPVACQQFQDQFKEARGRRYAKLNKTTSGFTRYNDGDVVGVATDWMVKQGVCPADNRYSHNSGRKSLARLLSKYNIGYEVGFEIHGDRWCVWQKNYQPDCASSSFERRDQHRNPDVCCAALRRIAQGFGLGIVKAKPMSRLERFMHSILMNTDPQLAEAIRTGAKEDAAESDSDDDDDFFARVPPSPQTRPPVRVPGPPPKRKRPNPKVADDEKEWRG